jgi:sugar phosphate isomerase/epimerase
MKRSISNIAWGAEHDEIMYAYLKNIGIQGLEIAPTRVFPEDPYDKLSEAKEWAIRLKEDYALEISSMQSIWYGRSENIFNSDSDRKSLIEYTKKAILFAETVHCKNIVFGCPHNRDTDDVIGNYSIAIDFFKETGDFAASHDTIIALEPNPPIYNTRFINTTAQAFEFAGRCNNSGLKVNVDLGTIICNQEPLNILQQNASLINHVHISEPGLACINWGNLHQELFYVLQSIGYKYFVSIEMKNLNNISTVKDVVKTLKKKYI